MNLDLFLSESFSKELQTLNQTSTSSTSSKESCQNCEVLNQQLDLTKQELASCKKQIAQMQESKTSKNKLEVVEVELQVLKELSAKNKVLFNQEISFI
jgi:hypothetical protein